MENARFIIRRAHPADAERLFEHLERHFDESGRDGDLIFQPCTWTRTWIKDEQVEKFRASWCTPFNRVGWNATWILDNGERIIGHSDLTSARMESALHRCVFGMGLEREARGQGFGKRLALEAVEWARNQDGIDWIDLHVFAHNAPALALYTQLRFETTGSVRDTFRVNGQKIDDIHMCLYVGS